MVGTLQRLVGGAEVVEGSEHGSVGARALGNPPAVENYQNATVSCWHGLFLL